jgi:RNA polymerase sigma factor (sigma-70 family)
MSSSTLESGVRHLRCLLAGQGRPEESDEQLLHAFTSCRDEVAFAVLMRRHGSMVLRVCRRVLGHEQDAEDAFQATFLVLAQSAASLRKRTSLASFLHGTAYRTAMKAKRSAIRRSKHEGRAPIRPSVPLADDISWREVRALLDEEIARLPEKYQRVFVLCCLEDLSQAQAARRLGLKEPTLSSQLAEAHRRLAKRLSRRGVELTAVLAASTLAAQQASAVPAGLMVSTMKAALAMGAGEPLSGIVSASVIELVKSAMSAMMVSKAKIATAILMTASMLAGASAWAYRGFAANELAPIAPPAEPPVDKAGNKPRTTSSKRETTKSVEIQGHVLDPDGKPKAGAKILLLDKGEKSQQLGTTAAEGRFRVSIPPEAKDGYLFAQAEGFGMDFLEISKSDLKKALEFRLVKDRPIRGRIVNTEGKPVAGVRVAVKSVNVYPNRSLDSFLAVWKKRHYMSGIPSGEKHLWTEAATLLAAITDAEGRFVLHDVGEERLIELRLSGAGIAAIQAWIANRDNFDPKPYNQATRDNTPKGREHDSTCWMLYGPEVSIVAETEKPIRGIVTDADTGQARPGVVVRLARIDNGKLVSPVVQAKTDAEGRYEIHGIRKTKRYMLDIADDVSAGYLRCQVWADDTTGYQPITADIKTKKGVIITGKIIDQATGKPIPGFAMADVLQNNPFAKNYPPFDNSSSFPMKNTDAGGVFRVVAIPGSVILMGGPRSYESRFQFKHPMPDPKYPQYFNTRETLGFFAVYLSSRGGMSPVQGNHCKVLEIKPDAKIVEQDIVLERASVLAVTIQDADDKPLSVVWVAGNSPEDWHYPTQCDKSECSVYQLDSNKPRLVVFFHLARKLTGTLALKGDEKGSVAAKLGPAGSIKGRLLDADGKPLSGVIVDVNYRQRAVKEIHNHVHREKQVVSDADGAFTVEDLVPDQKFELSVHRGPFKRKYEFVAKPADPANQIKPGECRDLGAIKLRRVPESAGE